MSGEEESDDKSYYYYYNKHGDVTALYSLKEGKIVVQCDYDAFGNIQKGENSEVVTTVLFMYANKVDGVYGVTSGGSAHAGMGVGISSSVLFDKQGNIVLAQTLAHSSISDAEVSINAGAIISPKTDNAFDMMGSSWELNGGGDIPVPLPFSLGVDVGVSGSTDVEGPVAYSLVVEGGLGVSPVEVGPGIATTVPTAAYNVDFGNGVYTNPLLSGMGIEAVLFNTKKLSLEIVRK